MCTHCSLLLKDPVQTSETGKRYCKECFDIVKYVSIQLRARESPTQKKGRGSVASLADGGFHLLYQRMSHAHTYCRVICDRCQSKSQRARVRIYAQLMAIQSRSLFSVNRVKRRAQSIIKCNLYKYTALHKIIRFLQFTVEAKLEILDMFWCF